MKQYNDDVAGNSAVEMIHVSLDQDEDAAEAWAAKEGFPWPTVLKDKVGRSGLEQYMPQGIPNYKLISKDGEVVAEGKGPVFQKIASLKNDSGA